MGLRVGQESRAREGAEGIVIEVADGIVVGIVGGHRVLRYRLWCVYVISLYLVFIYLYLSISNTPTVPKLFTVSKLPTTITSLLQLLKPSLHLLQLFPSSFHLPSFLLCERTPSYLPQRLRGRARMDPNARSLQHSPTA